MGLWMYHVGLAVECGYGMTCIYRGWVDGGAASHTMSPPLRAEEQWGWAAEEDAELPAAEGGFWAWV